MRRWTLDDIIAMLGFGVVAVAFGWFFYQNLLFTGDFDLIVLRDIDDTIFQHFLREQRNFLYTGDLIQFFGRNAFSYGNLYWVLASLTSLPFDIVGLERGTIAAPRMLSLAASLTCVILFLLICKTRRIQPAAAALGAVLLICNGFFANAALRFHNHSLVAAFLLASIFVFLLPSSRKNQIWGAVFFGLAVGTKLSAIYFFPFFVFLSNKDKEWRSMTVLKNLQENLICGIVSIFAFTLAFSPASWLILIGNTQPLNEAISTSQYIVLKTLYAFSADPQPWLVKLRDGFLLHSYHIFVCAIAFMGAVFLLLKKRGAKNTSITVPILLLLAYLTIAMYTKSGVDDFYSPGLYGLAAAAMIPLVLSELSLLNKSLALCSLTASIAVNLYFNYSAILNTHYLRPYTLRYSAESHAVLQRFEHYKKRIHLDINDNIYTDFRIVFPLQALERPIRPSYHFDGDNIDNAFPHNVVILLKDSIVWKNDCNEAESLTGLKPESCAIYKEIMAEKRSFTKIFSDEFIEIFRKPL